MNRLAITKIELKGKEHLAYMELNEKREFVDFELYESEKSILNNIYIGRVQKIVPNIEAAFVRISPEITCYLPLSDMDHAFFTLKHSQKNALSEGDELIVQVIRDAIKTKKPQVSAKLTLRGAYSILSTHNTMLSVSKKLPSEERAEKKAFLERICAGHSEENYGIVLRTNCTRAAEEELTEDIEHLKKRLGEILSSTSLAAFSLLYEEVPGYVKRLQAVREFSADRIDTDVPQVYQTLSRNLPYLREKIFLYEDELVSLSALYNIRGSVDKLLDRRVWLDSGANIIIEQLETMTVIDVNTAKNLKLPKNEDIREQHFLNVNLEAAVEIARQIRLRNLSGMILVDFINLKKEESIRRLIAALKKELDQDTVPCRFVDITKLNLVEITRKKTTASLHEMIDK